MRRLNSIHIIRLAVLLLHLLSMAYLVKGFHHLILDPGGAIDFQQRWVEQRFILKGKNPAEFTQWHHALQEGKSLPREVRQEILDTGIRFVSPAVYPPWAYVTALPLMWPDHFTVGRWYYALTQLVLILLLAVRLYVLAKPAGLEASLLLVASLLAVSSLCSTLGVGQYGIVVLAALVGAEWLDRNNHPVGAGLLLGCSLVKVTLAAPFLLIPLIQKHRFSLLVAAAFVLTSSLLVCWWIQTPFETMMRQVKDSAASYADMGYGPLDLALNAGIDPERALLLTAGLGISVTFVLLIVWQKANTLTQAAIAAVAARSWTYHNLYDNVIVALLLLAIAAAAHRHHSKTAWIMFGLIGLSLWAPARLTQYDWFIQYQFAIWFVGLVFLLWLDRPWKHKKLPAHEATGT